MHRTYQMTHPAVTKIAVKSYIFSFKRIFIIRKATADSRKKTNSETKTRIIQQIRQKKHWRNSKKELLFFSNLEMT